MMNRHEVTSPLPGVFYRRPEPGTPEFVQVGQTVAAEETVGLIEIMKSFHTVSAGVSGTVVEIMAESESEVEPGQVLVAIEDGT